MKVGIGSKVRVAIGRARAVGIISEKGQDSELGSFYKIKVASASSQMQGRLDVNKGLWICLSEIQKVF